MSVSARLMPVPTLRMLTTMAAMGQSGADARGHADAARVDVEAVL